MTLPRVLGIAAVKMLKVVDFPAPLGPRSPKVSPFSIKKELSLMATWPFGYFLNKESTTIGFVSVTLLIFDFYFLRSYDLLNICSELVISCLSFKLNFQLSSSKTSPK